MHHLHSLTRLVNQPSAPHLLELVGILVLVTVVVRVAFKVSLATLFTFDVASEIFSGNWKYIPFPLPLDRIVFVLLLGLLAWRTPKRVSDRRLLLRPIHFLLLGLATYVFLNGLWAGSVLHSLGFFSWLDRLGVIPFVAFTLAPIIFSSQRSRDILLIGMTLVGLYLGYDAAMEMLRVKALVFPHYINNPNLGIQAGRARGPFLESDALGLALLDTGVFAALAAHRWNGYRVGRFCIGVAALDALGILFTLTRASWLGALVALIGAGLWHPRLRRRLPVVVLVGGLAMGGALLAVPGLSHKAVGRVDTTRSVWDRFNTDIAAFRAVGTHPVFGIGWETFETKGPSYLRESQQYPLTGIGIEVHNVFLSHVTELGIIPGLLWAVALFAAVGGGILRRGPPELWVWRVGLLAIFLMFLVEANLAPLSYPFPNLVIWTMAGIVGRDRYSVPRSAEAERTATNGGLPALVRT